MLFSQGKCWRSRAVMQPCLLYSASGQKGRIWTVTSRNNGSQQAPLLLHISHPWTLITNGGKVFVSCHCIVPPSPPLFLHLMSILWQPMYNSSIFELWKSMFQALNLRLAHFVPLLICINRNESSCTLQKLRLVQMALQSQKGLISAAEDVCCSCGEKYLKGSNPNKRKRWAHFWHSKSLLSATGFHSFQDLSVCCTIILLSYLPQETYHFLSYVVLFILSAHWYAYSTLANLLASIQIK